MKANKNKHLRKIIPPPQVLPMFIEKKIRAKESEIKSVNNSDSCQCYNQCDNCYTQCDCLSCYK